MRTLCGEHASVCIYLSVSNRSVRRKRGACQSRFGKSLGTFGCLVEVYRQLTSARLICVLDPATGELKCAARNRDHYPLVATYRHGRTLLGSFSLFVYASYLCSEF